MDVEFHLALIEWNFQDGRYDYPPVNASFVTQTSSLFLKTLQSMPNLQNLSVEIPDLSHHHTAFSEAIDSVPQAALPITQLTLGQFGHSLIRHSPKLQAAKMRDWRWANGNSTAFEAFVDALKRFPGNELHRVGISYRMDEKVLQALLTAVPHIKSLIFQIGTGWSGSVKDLIPTLNLFQSLEELQLADVSSLGLGFDPPWCGNSYMDDPTLADRVGEEARVYERMVFEMMCKGLPRLNLLRFNDEGTQFDLTHKECLEWRERCKDQTDCYSNVTLPEGWRSSV
ncbi:hypothetical protein C8J56DRAFT_952011, partial [Mycena floridula]